MSDSFIEDVVSQAKAIARLSQEVGELSVKLAFVARELADLREFFKPRPLEGEPVFVIIDEHVVN